MGPDAGRGACGWRWGLFSLHTKGKGRLATHNLAETAVYSAKLHTQTELSSLL